MAPYQSTRKRMKIIQSVPIVTTFDNESVLKHILSFVGDKQYRFIAGVNHTFHDAYSALHPSKETYCNASTMKHMMFCYNEIAQDKRMSLFGSAAIHGNIEALQYLHSKGWCKLEFFFISMPASRMVVKNGHLNVLKWAHQNGLEMRWINYIIYAATYGNITMIQWLYTNHGSEFDDLACGYAACGYAARGGHLHVIKWLQTKGCPLHINTCSYAAEHGHLEVLQWAQTKGCPWDKYTCSNAAKNGHLEVLQWAQTKGCPWDEYTCSNAAKNGHLEVLQWAQTKGCPWDRNTCSNAAYNGHLEVLQWARTNGCPWDEYTCSNAAYNGHLEVLQWVQTNGCPWDEDTCFNAAMNGHFELLKWAYEHGCPWKKEVTHLARITGNDEMFEWAKSNGCPIN
jgi:Ankyrin repeats (many copies)